MCRVCGPEVSGGRASDSATVPWLSVLRSAIGSLTPSEVCRRTLTSASGMGSPAPRSRTWMRSATGPSASQRDCPRTTVSCESGPRWAEAHDHMKAPAAIAAKAVTSLPTWLRGRVGAGEAVGVVSGSLMAVFFLVSDNHVKCPGLGPARRDGTATHPALGIGIIGCAGSSCGTARAARQKKKGMCLGRILIAQKAGGVEFVVDLGDQGVHPASQALCEVSRGVAVTFVTGS